MDPLAAQFLRMIQYDAGHRLFTYVITLDAQWRFAETGDEFAIEMLSKHSMHAEAALYIAYSGEMFEEDEADSRNDKKKYPPSAYELVIDNDSGTYRVHKELLPLLAEFLGGEANLGMLLFFPPPSMIHNHHTPFVSLHRLTHRNTTIGGPGGLGKITAIDGFDEGLNNTKKHRAEAKRSQREGGETRRV
ncbi:hypothetical protein FRC10_011074 [Ceratobasidium sp. 414]|nr:hypothetical protein FRC10_011074 [Ceratobasidium sp. 414]